MGDLYQICSSLAITQVLYQPGVDARHTTSNHIIEIINVLGIEAARNALMKEFRNVIEFDGSYVNYRHLDTLVGLICRAQGWQVMLPGQWTCEARSDPFTSSYLPGPFMQSLTTSPCGKDVPHSSKGQWPADCCRLTP